MEEEPSGLQQTLADALLGKHELEQDQENWEPTLYEAAHNYYQNLIKDLEDILDVYSAWIVESEDSYAVLYPRWTPLTQDTVTGR